jgi:dipeptidase E
MRRFLLMSSSRREALGYLEHADRQLERLFAGKVRNVLLLPYASVRASYDAFEQTVATPFARHGMTITSIHHCADPVAAVREAEALAVAGGNTFVLLRGIQENGLLQPVRERVAAGMPYVGWSAGANVACPTIRTSNDMAIVAPASFEGFALVPFQINPHFIPGRPPGHNVETREERLQEFMLANPGENVLALPEGSALYCEDDSAEVMGDRGALVMTPAGTTTWPEGHRFALASVNGTGAR